jgi:hypothetical protein
MVARREKGERSKEGGKLLRELKAKRKESKRAGTCPLRQQDTETKYHQPLLVAA